MIQRAAAALGAVWLAVTLAFFALRVLPGDALDAQLRESGASAPIIAERRAALGLDQPTLVQYGDYLLSAIQGDFGVSLLDGRPVAEIIIGQLPATAVLTFAALVIAVTLGGVIGWFAEYNVIARVLLSLSLSAPLFWTGTIAILIAAVRLNLLPASGAGRLDQLILPASVLGFHTAGGIAQVVWAATQETRAQDFVRTAHAKGLPIALVARRHVLRASLPPILAVIALQTGFLFTGSVITESLFARPGLGRVLLDAVLQQNYPVVQGIIVFSAGVYALLNLSADAAQRLLDPRVQA